MLTETPTADNVLAVYRAASFAAFSEGIDWYSDAHNVALTLDPENPARAAGIIAALSPMNGWTNNKRKAAQLYAQGGDGSGCGLYRNVAKAVAIYNGADPIDILKGDKVTAFFRTILDPFGDIDPVIDRHAFDIAVGERTNDKRRGALSRKGYYQAFASVYREAASVAGIGSAQMQAITWMHWRDMHGIKA